MELKNGYVYDPPFPKSFASELLVIEEGRGVYLTDAAGKQYLDFGSGIAVNALGYGREDLAGIVSRQMMKLVHISNLFTTKPAIELAGKLTASGPFAAVHFGNSGTEANEAALKFARLYSMRKKGPGHHKLLSFQSAFHGRSAGALSVTPTLAYREPFEPLIPGCVTAPFNDIAALEKILDPGFAGVIVEVVQGEGGLARMSPEFAKALRELCTKHDVILIADEVQTGLGRTGTLYASEAVGLSPDIVTLAKPLAAGLPLSATLIPAKVNDLVKLGEHGTTFGGGPVTTVVANYVWDMLSDKSFLAEVRRKGELLAELLGGLTKYRLIAEVRGAGLLRGLALAQSAGPDVLKNIMAAAREEGLLVLRSGANVVRIAPPLVITDDEIREGVVRLETAIRKLSA
jgi:acetylornithine/N-succinyldiaminopimelate aminotransferase